MIRSLLHIGPLLLVPILCLGCSGAEAIRSEGEAPWSGCGVTLALPPGQWTTDVLEADRCIELHNETGGASLLVFRFEAREELPPVVAIRRLFAAFDEKTLLAESSFVLPDGAPGMRALYDVKVGKEKRRVMAVAFRKGACMVDLAAWGMSREDFDAVVSSVSACE